MMKNKVFNIVNELLEKYLSGQIFFTELDKAVKFDRDILELLVRKAEREFGNLGVTTIASGEIGLAMHNMGVQVDFLVPGGLRHDPSKINLAPFVDKIRGNLFVFIDDSFFSGKTATVIEEEIERLGGSFLGTLVVYDGAEEKYDNVWSLYRYYDYHDILGRKIKED